MQPWNVGRLRVPEARASATSQMAVYLVAAFAFGIIGWSTRGYDHAVAAMMALGAGALIGSTTEVDRLFRNAPGIVLGVLTSVALTAGSAFLVGLLELDVGGADGATQLLLGAGLLVAGLDWRRVTRLKVVPALAGIPVVIVVAAADGPVLALGVGWLALAVAALWSLEVDQRRAYDQPRALGPTGDTAAGDGARDLAGSLVLALLLGLVLATFAAVPSCSPSLGRWDLPWRPSGGGHRDVLGGPDLLRFDSNWGEFGFRNPGDQPMVDIDGVPHRLVEGESGRPELENTQTGERLSLAVEGEDLVARDRNGTERARFSKVDQAAQDRGGGRDWRIVALVVAAVLAAAALLWWWLRRRRPPPDDPRSWAEARVRELERFGRGHGQARTVDETVRHHSQRLATTVADDPRLHRVGDVLSDALFGHGDPTVETRLWTEQVIQEVAAAHPAPRWWHRDRRRPADPTEVPTEAPAAPA